jgi:hypothetical protein
MGRRWPDILRCLLRPNPSPLTRPTLNIGLQSLAGEVCSSKSFDTRKCCCFKLCRQANSLSELNFSLTGQKGGHPLGGLDDKECLDVTEATQSHLY